MTEVIYDADTLWELVERRAADTPKGTMLIDQDDRTVTFGEFRDRSERVAAGLLALGVTADTPVAWQLPTRIESIVLSFALARLGATQVPIIPIYREREVGSVLQQAGARWFAVPGTWRGFDYEEMARGLQDSSGQAFGVIVVDADLPGGGLPEGDPSSLPPAPTDGDAVRWLYSTSGTTAAPKCVMHTDAGLIAGGVGLAVAMQPAADDVGSIAFPCTHIGGPDYLVMVLAHGMPTVLLETFTPAGAVEVFNRHHVTAAGGSTAFYLAYLNEQRKDPSQPVIPSLRILSGGGAPKPPEVFREVRAEMHIPILHGYGMTECPMIASGAVGDDDEQLANTDGAPVLGCEVQIVGEDGRPVAAGVAGEVRVRGPMLAKGYTDPELTAAAFGADGFFTTGDRGYLREDGHIVLTGRTKEMIIRKGENISPREIEDLLQTHPKVAAVAVIGLPDRERGERVCAVVETAAGETPLTFLELQEFCRGAGLMAQKIPEQLEVVDVLPRNATMKILKHELVKQFREESV
ncbi:MAG: cyclohexanecarboxylate-CoA ligase [Actinomycetota bacterium]|nr:cyclohexanecarboxylate-CoA ligase [Actinomycetota bacterium]